ncbi:MAG: DUF1127 domain-containing protein [Alphaproteobacteria bacterium]|nr:DUF1127 domain-containing protein [Alphaproteobacteria bacterium]
MEKQNCIDTMPSSTAPAKFGLPPWLKSMLRLAGLWIERGRQRRQLRELSDAALRDIGLARADVQSETAKPFWRP